jgi:hypothetical protein
MQIQILAADFFAFSAFLISFSSAANNDFSTIFHSGHIATIIRSSSLYSSIHLHLSFPTKPNWQHP